MTTILAPGAAPYRPNMDFVRPSLELPNYAPTVTVGDLFADINEHVDRYAFVLLRDKLKSQEPPLIAVTARTWDAMVRLVRLSEKYADQVDRLTAEMDRQKAELDRRKPGSRRRRATFVDPETGETQTMEAALEDLEADA